MSIIFLALRFFGAPGANTEFDKIIFLVLLGIDITNVYQHKILKYTKLRWNKYNSITK